MADPVTIFGKNLVAFIDERHGGNISAAVRAWGLPGYKVRRWLTSESLPSGSDLIKLVEAIGTDARIVHMDLSDYGFNILHDARECPNCGSDMLASVDVRDGTSGEFKGRAVCCFNCGARGEPRHMLHFAIENWNTVDPVTQIVHVVEK